jgi:tRNA pseudouridine55 synthase
MHGEGREPVAGVLNIHKAGGWTSHDVVARLRRITGTRRIGHAGTLDPMATGVLVVCVGKATRVVEYLADGDKEYRATLRFGMVTDTWDAEGQVVDERDASGLTRGAVEDALAAFRGEIRQVPPMYSALKRDGQPLYRLARQGISVEREAREVTIHRLEMVGWRADAAVGAPEAVLQVRCTKGTYIRSLAHDLGEALGVGAHLSGLVRTAVGAFALDEAVSLETLAEAEGAWMRYLVPLRRALAGMPGVVLDADTAQRVIYGQAVDLADLDAPVRVDAGSGEICAYDDAGQLVAILRRDDDLWRPHKVLADSI